MNKNLPKRAQDIKGAVAIAELRRAHYIIVILTLSLAGMMAVATSYVVQFNAPLSIVTVILLCLVATISLSTIFALRKR